MFNVCEGLQLPFLALPRRTADVAWGVGEAVKGEKENLKSHTCKPTCSDPLTFSPRAQSNEQDSRSLWNSALG